MKKQKLINLDKEDIRNVADGRLYGGRGIGFIYRVFNGVSILMTMVAAIYFLLIDSASPFENVHSSIPEAIQHAPVWLYYLLIISILISLVIMALLSFLLNARSKKIVNDWEKTGILPVRSGSKKRMAGNGSKPATKQD